MSEPRLISSVLRHGAAQLPGVVVDSYNINLQDFRDSARRPCKPRCFLALVKDWRERLRKLGYDGPLGEISADELKKKKLDQLLMQADPEAAALIHSAMEEFAQELVGVVGRFLRLKEWRATHSILIGGGFRASRLGQLAIARAGLLLKANGQDVELEPIRHHPDEAGLIGCVRLAPSWVFSGHRGILAVDIGGTNIRAGIVGARSQKEQNLFGCSCGGVQSLASRRRTTEPRRNR